MQQKPRDHFQHATLNNYIRRSSVSLDSLTCSLTDAAHSFAAAALRGPAQQPYPLSGESTIAVLGPKCQLLPVVSPSIVDQSSMFRVLKRHLYFVARMNQADDDAGHNTY